MNTCRKWWLSSFPYQNELMSIIRTINVVLFVELQRAGSYFINIINSLFQSFGSQICCLFLIILYNKSNIFLVLNCWSNLTKSYIFLNFLLTDTQPADAPAINKTMSVLLCILQLRDLQGFKIELLSDQMREYLWKNVYCWIFDPLMLYAGFYSTCPSTVGNMLKRFHLQDEINLLTLTDVILKRRSEGPRN